MKTAFIDPCNYKPYSLDVLANEALGGTEATVLRVVHGLGVDHYQKPLPDSIPDYDNYIVLRDPYFACLLREQKPNATIWVWMHDLQPNTSQNQFIYTRLAEAEIGIVAVSLFHAAQCKAIMRSSGVNLPLKTIYNPVDTSVLRPLKTNHRGNYFCFTSSPHKGLEDTLSLFQELKKTNEFKDFKLKVFNPGYFDINSTNLGKDVELIGPKPHLEVMKELAGAFALLHFNFVFPETFGIVHAEAMALDVPVLTSNLGANHEILNHPDFTLNSKDPREAIRILKNWKEFGPPKCLLNNSFQLYNILQRWQNLLNG